MGYAGFFVVWDHCGLNCLFAFAGSLGGKNAYAVCGQGGLGGVDVDGGRGGGAGGVGWVWHRYL